MGRDPVPVASGLLELMRQTPEYKRRALLYWKHCWKVRTLSRALAKALDECVQASTWPGERLQVSLHMSEQVELITRRLQLESKAYARICA
jgi:hypothetical protein